MKAPRPLQSPIAQMPLDVGAQLVVDRDVAARVGLDAGVVEAEIVGVGPPADREQQMRARRSASAPSRGSTVERRRPAVTNRCVGADVDVDALVSRMSLIAAETSSSSRAISRGPFSIDRHLGAEAAVHLRELEPDIAAADDHQCSGSVSRSRMRRW